MKHLYYGGTIITMEENLNINAILVEDGKITEVGNFKNFQQYLNDDGVEKHNLKGKILLPGFIDAHSHLSMIGPMSVVVDLSNCESFEDIIKALKVYIEKRSVTKNEVVYGFGYDHNFLMEECHPTKEILNQISTEIPIFISHASGHIGCANDAALTIANINENTSSKKGGMIGRIEGSNEPNGYLEEENMMALQMIIFSKLKLNQKQLTLVGQEQYIKNGITTVQDGATSKDMIFNFSKLAEEKKLIIDVVAYPQVMDKEDYATKSSQHWKKYQNHFKINGYKLFLDGSPQAKTAWLTKPYANEEVYRGYPLFQDNQVEEYIFKAINNDAQLLTHCNGDAASDQLIKNYERALERSNNPNKNHLRPVMIHCQTVREDQLDAMKRLNMIPSIFVEHTYYWGDIHLKNLGEIRGHNISPAQSAFKRNLKTNFHQDAPVVKVDILHMIWAAVNRITRKGRIVGEHQKVSVYNALKAVTINAAYAYFEEEIKGSIKKGKKADFVILDKNPLTVDKMEIKNIQVVETIKDGITIYKNSSY